MSKRASIKTETGYIETYLYWINVFSPASVTHKILLGSGLFSEEQLRRLLIYTYAIGELGKGNYDIKKPSLRYLLRRLQRQTKTKEHFQNADGSLLGKVLNQYEYLGRTEKFEGVFRIKPSALQTLLDNLCKYLLNY